MTLRPFGRFAGFTLIELLAVMGIIAVLAGLLFPAITRARDWGRRAKCSANVRQIVAGLHMYAQDNRRRLPSVTGYCSVGGKTGSSGAYGGGTPAEQRPLYRYLPDAGLFQCPSDRGSKEANLTDVFEACGSSYCFPYQNQAGIKAANNLLITTEQFASKKIVIFEPPFLEANNAADNENQWHSTQKASMLGFLDGHVDFLVSFNYSGTINETNQYYY